MRTASAGLISLLNSSQTFVMADLYTITLVSGTVVRYTDSSIDLTVSGNTFLSSGPIFKRSRVRIMVGTEVDTLEVTISALPTNLLAGVPWLQAIRNGALDGATLRLDRFLSDVWTDTSRGAINNWFTGRVAPVSVGRSTAKIEVKSDLELLNVQMPRNLYQPGCVHTLYDAGCTLSKGSFSTSSAVASGSTVVKINCALAQAAGYFDLGTLSFTSGVNNGVTRSIKSYTPGVFNLSLPLFQACTNGDTFTAYLGCDKTQATCTTKFNNLVNFRGFPFIPIPETVL